MTAAKPIIAAIFPALIESAPKSGPTDRSSNIINGAGSAPALRSIANSFASSDVKPPDIWPEPPRIASLITGALTTLSSSIIAKGFPTFCCVTLPNWGLKQDRQEIAGEINRKEGELERHTRAFVSGTVDALSISEDKSKEEKPYAVKKQILRNEILPYYNIKLVFDDEPKNAEMFKKLGLITVDEEHDQSYKQDEGIIYNARDMAISRSKHENIPINLVTAVPSIETYENIKNKKYNYSRLLNRYKGANLPKHHVIDLYQNQLATKSSISLKTLEKVKEHLNKKDQVLFFINRRGFAPYVLCKKCLNVFTCPKCSINLVFHKSKKILLCHYCGYNSKLNRDCKKGNICEFIFSGPGVEKIAEEVKNLFPNKKTIIFSSDTMNKASGKDKLDKIVSGEIDILVGTQLISKGFHFPNLNCIVVLDIDLTSQGHDLRSTEKNLQLYHQSVSYTHLTLPTIYSV